jgi:predicted RNase H-like nuclease (RuvC/YqgF family)
MSTKIEKQNVISFRYGKNEETDYILTLDGKEIGRVYELEFAQRIESMARQITTLEIDNEQLKEDVERLDNDNADLQSQIEHLEYGGENI